MDYSNYSNEQLEQLVANKDYEAIRELAERCKNGSKGQAVNLTKAAKLYHKGEKAGFSWAYEAIGDMYANGICYAQNIELANEYYKKAGVNKGNINVVQANIEQQHTVNNSGTKQGNVISNYNYSNNSTYTSSNNNPINNSVSKNFNNLFFNMKNKSKNIFIAIASLFIICLLGFGIKSIMGNSTDKLIDNVCEAVLRYDVNELVELGAPDDDVAARSELYEYVDVFVDDAQEFGVGKLERIDDKLLECNTEEIMNLSKAFKDKIKEMKKATVVANDKVYFNVYVYKIKGKWYGFIKEI